MMSRVLVLSLILLGADAFAPMREKMSRTISPAETSTTSRQALWRHWVPETDVWDVDDDVSCFKSEDGHRPSEVKYAKPILLTSLLAAVLMIAPQVTVAVSGGGLDFAGTDISGQDFSNNPTDYKGKDFTQVLAKGTNFAKSNLQGLE